MNDAERLLDTDILIDHLRGYPPAKGYIDPYETKAMKGLVSVITVQELYAGKRMDDPSEMDEAEKLLGLFEEVNVDPVIARRAGEYVRKYGSAFPNAAIAATCVLRGAKLVTRNTKHYQSIPEVELEVPY